MTTVGRFLRGTIAAVTTTVLVATAIVFTSGSAAIAADPPQTVPPLLQRDESVVSGDPLPTVQIDSGYVWSQTTIGTRAYAVGQFTNARAALAVPGTSLTPRSNILSFDMNSGALLPFAPTVNGTIKAVAASPDGSRIYIGGSFNSVNGQTRWNIAALDATTGALIPGFSPSIGGSGVYALAADANAVYVGGLFTQANGTPRKNLAAFAASNGALRMDWDSQPEQQVDAMVLDPDGQNVIVGGRFANVDGDGAWRGLVSISRNTGAINSSWAGTAKVKNGWATGGNRGKAGIFGLNADDSGVYGTGWVFASATEGNLEGVFALESTSGTTRWIADCLGDHYGVYSTGSVVYSTTHTHACGTMNLWPEQNPRTHRFVHAMTADVRGVLGNQPAAGGTYVNWQGEPAPAAYAWYPDFFTGTATGLGQAGLSITGAGNVISIAGEFPGVNNQQFQGIVRFSTTPPGGAKDGPRTTTATWGAPTASTAVPGRIRLSIAGTWDRDDRDLTYELSRTGTGGILAAKTVSNGWWNTQSVSLDDTTVTAGATYTYTITVKDGDGNAVVSQPVTATASSSAALAYTNTVFDDGAGLYYPLGSSTTDWAGANAPVTGSGVVARQPGAVVGSGTGYSDFNGTTSGRVSTTSRPATPDEFSTELWFRTTTNRGGKLIGYGNAQTGSSSSYDRHVYMRNDGRLMFGLYTGQTVVVTTPSSYNNGQWHHVVATAGPEGMKLYVDGQLVGSDASTTRGESFSGYWRIGGDNLGSWPNRPTSDWFSGSIDEVAVYPVALTAAQVSNHFAVGTGIAPPTASFASMPDGLAVEFDASGSSAAGNGSIAEYVWDFGDGSPIVTRTSSSAQHTFAESGTYTVSLTVRDNRGLLSTTSLPVTVLGPNTAPVASFTASAEGLTATVDGTASSDEDGSIQSYEWDWGDDSAPGTDALASHTYGAAGSYAITLTVTDDREGTHSVTHQVEVTHADPVAAFDVVATGTSVTVDAAASTASDGATLDYSWDWGDGGAPASGAQASHSYGEGGTYDITLTVTDSFGASASIVRTVNVESTLYAVLDDFSRTVSNGWGATPAGGAWTTMLGSSSIASVDGERAVLALGAGSTRQMAQQSVSLRDTESVLDYRTGFAPSVGAAYVGMTLRQSATSGYTIHAWHRNNGTVWLVAQQGGSVVATQAISGMTWAAGDEFTLKTEVSGASPTTLRAKIWKAGAAEPQSWQLDATDSTAALQQAGFVSVRANLGSTATAPGPVAFDRVSIRDLGAPAANVPPVASFASSGTGLSVSVDASASSDSDGTITGYEWDWGDGSPKSSGATASHAYVNPGEYTVTLTVTDDGGATHSTTAAFVAVADDGEPEPGENLPPVADFTAVVDGGTVSVDAAASADPDGTIASYTWDWGDGAPADTGVNASHAYTDPGTYTITLTVTDDGGAEHSTTREVTVEQAPVDSVLVRDDFDRTATSSWGAADVGGGWAISGGAASAASVSDGRARLALAAGSTRIAMLADSALTEYIGELEFQTDAGPETGASYVGVVARDTGSGTYLVHAWLRPNGTVWLIVQRGGDVLQSSTLAGLTYQAGDSFTLKLEVTGAGSTQLRAKLWKNGSAEPDWQLTVQDSTSGLQAAGKAGLRANRTSASTSPVSISFDRFLISAIE